jgi:hypothetical protein
VPEIDLLPPIAALSVAFALALLFRLYLAMASRADSRRTEQVLRRLEQRDEPGPETHDA